MTARRPPTLPLLLLALLSSWPVAAPRGQTISATGPSTEEPDALAQAITSFWRAPGPAARLALIPELLALNDDVQALHAALARGPAYDADVPRGRMVRQRVAADGTVFPWVLLVPEDYDPTQRHFVRVDLHGGMGVKGWDPTSGAWDPGHTPLSGQIKIVPAGWWDAMWWTAEQTANLAALLDEVKRDYNVDEDRVLLVGSSDGCIGSLFHAFRAPDAYAGFGGFVGCPVRLTNPTLRVDGQMHLPNLAGQSFFLGNGGRDRLFPVEDIRAYWELFERHAAALTYLEYPRQGHDLALPAEDEQRWARFLFGARRAAHPDRVSWSTERSDRYARRSWLEIVALGEAASDDPSLAEGVVLPRICTGRYRRLEPPAPQPFGRVDLEREGNTVRARTWGVRRFRLLLSPETFDLDAEIVVLVNGQEVHRAVVPRDPRLLLERAARDLDRRRLYTAALDVEVP